jgi:hypothetical protein
MFEQAIRASEAMQLASQQGDGTLIPALCHCQTCDATQMVSSPVLGTCTHCGSRLLHTGDQTRRSPPAHPTDALAA